MHSNVSLEELCALFGKSRQAYYKSKAYADSHQEWHGQILEYVRGQRKDQPRIGAEKLQGMLHAEASISIGRDALYDLLRSNGLLIKQRKKYRPPTTNGDGSSIYPDLRNQAEPILAINKLWSTDITYLKLVENGKYCYATFIVDEYSHLIVGYVVATDMTAIATIEALKMAVDKQGTAPERKFNFELVFHSDRGGQFKSALFQDFLSRHEIKCSMTKDGKPSENPVSERLNGIIKNELVGLDDFKNFEQASQLIARAVHIYNTRRPHRSCNMLTPLQAHNYSGQPLKKLWKQRKIHRMAKAT